MPGAANGWKALLLLPNSLLMPGSSEQGPMMVHVVWVNQRAFRLQWCPKCCFHRPPRTYHCPWCNICVEVSDLFYCPPAPTPPLPGRPTYKGACGRRETTSGTTKGQEWQ